MFRAVVVLPSEHYVYYTWDDPMKEEKIIICINEKNFRLEMNECCGIFDKESVDPVYYSLFINGGEKVLIVSRDVEVIDSISDVSRIDLEKKNIK